MLTIIQNDPDVPPGDYAHVLERAGIPHRIVAAWRGDGLPRAADCRAVIMLGGSMSAHDTDRFPFLVCVKGLIRDCLAGGTPYLGLCLGGQLLAEAAGGGVVRDRWQEIGVCSVSLTTEGMADPLFSGAGKDLPVFQWHHDSLDLPGGALLLASSPACPHQAFRCGRTAYGLQFHPEMNRSEVELWCRSTPEVSADTARILAAFDGFLPQYRRASRLLLENFLVCGGLLCPGGWGPAADQA